MFSMLSYVVKNVLYYYSKELHHYVAISYHIKEKKEVGIKMNYKMYIAYDGRRYKGFKKTKAFDDLTIQGKLESILYKKYDESIEVISSVNTDAGVHAHEQVVNFHTPNTIDEACDLRTYFDDYLPADIVVLSIEIADERFQSRFATNAITYTYRLWKKDAKSRPLFERSYINAMKEVLDTSKMIEAAKLLEGNHDFTAFTTRNKVKSPNKDIKEIKVKETDQEIIITMTANSFLINMERIIVGTLIQIGSGQKDISCIEKAFTYMDREYAGHKARAEALSLTKVHLK